ncbi:MAG TPA: hypothetical protein P5186_21155 [Candidatus Paceibacterota bacterium]|nr:hypothetical protein [Candidatus Paceibacterota bacterium]
MPWFEVSSLMHYLEVAETTLTVRLARPYYAGKACEWTHQPKVDVIIPACQARRGFRP